MISWQARLAHGLIRMVNLKKQTTKGVLNPPKRKHNSAILPAGLQKNFNVEFIEVDNRKIGLYKPKNSSSKKTLVYYHGGHYVNEAHPLMHKFIAKLAKKSKCNLCLMDYPLAPEDSYVENHKWCLDAYNAFNKKVEGEVILIGDSAGGGLALSLAQKMKEINHDSPPAKLMLLSPWLDLEFQIPLTEADEKKCLILHPDTMLAAAKMYGGNYDRSDYMLSPLNGDLKGVGKIAVWVGTEECAYKPSMALKEKGDELGLQIDFHLCQGMHHDFFLLPIPETKKAISEMSEFINH